MAGRAGRGHETGMVILQTYHPENYAIAAVKMHDYETFFKAEIEERKKYSYPPFARLIKLRMSDATEDKAKKFALEVYEKISEKKLSRRAVISGIATGAVVGGVAGVLSGALLAPKGTTGPAGVTGPAGAQGMAGPLLSSPGAVFPIKYATDVVVVGAGGGGMCAAVSAAQEGVKVLALEISQKTGGGQVYSGGILHDAGLKTWDDYLAYTEGLHDPNLGKTYVETFRNTFLPWLTAIGAYYTPGTGVGPLWTGDPKLGHGEPGTQGHRLYFASLETALTGFGGSPVLLKTRGLKLLTDANGKFAGVRASTWSASPTETNQDTFDITAKAAILACGNFFNNPELKMRYMGPYADKALNMGVPYARGDGMLMAQELGAALSGGFSTFSGVPVALTPVSNQTEADPDKFEQASAKSNPNGSDYGALVGVGRYFGPFWVALTGPLLGPSFGLMVNLEGRRFVDENSTEDSKYPRSSRAILDQRQGMAFVIGDEVIHDLVGGSQAMLDGLTAPGVGGTVVTANTLTDLAAGIATKFPFYSGNFLKTIADYNAAIDAGTTPQLDPPRTVLPTTSEKNGGLYKISTPPFYAFAVTVCMYYNMGGLAVNTNAQVLDMMKKPIPGLHATFPCAGGLMSTIYTGGNGSSSVFGYIAGKSAAKFVKTGTV